MTVDITMVAQPAPVDITMTVYPPDQGGGAVDSVNGQTGTVVLDADDVGAVAPGDLATVATTGAYSDLTGKPSIPDSPDDIGAAPKTPTVGTSLGTTGTVDLDLAALDGTVQWITATGNITLTTSNRAAGRGVRVFIDAGGSGRTLAYPAWIAHGAALPTSLASGKRLALSIISLGSTDANVSAAAAVQP